MSCDRPLLDRVKDEWLELFTADVEFRATISDSFANGNNVANVGVFSTLLADGTRADTELIAAYRLDDDGKIQSLRACWEIGRMMATLLKD